MTVDVSKINAGDQVTARFCSDWPTHHAPGVPFTITSEVIRPQHTETDSTVLLMAQGECLRDSLGRPGGNLVEIVEHIPSEPEWTTWPVIKIGDEYLVRIEGSSGAVRWQYIAGKSSIFDELSLTRVSLEAIVVSLSLDIVEAELRVVPKP